MNRLTRMLQCLKRTPRPWSLMIFPDPERSFRLKDPDCDFVFFMKLRGKVDLDEFYESNVITGIACNTRTPTARVSSTHWLKIIETGRNNKEGQSLRQILVDIMHEFPKYELESKEGAEVAIRDMDHRLGDVARFEKFHKPKRDWK